MSEKAVARRKRLIFRQATAFPFSRYFGLPLGSGSQWSRLNVMAHDVDDVDDMDTRDVCVPMRDGTDMDGHDDQALHHVESGSGIPIGICNQRNAHSKLHTEPQFGLQTVEVFRRGDGFDWGKRKIFDVVGDDVCRMVAFCDCSNETVLGVFESVGEPAKDDRLV